MLKLSLLFFLFILSLLVLFRAPARLLWYLSILVTEFSWVFLLLLLLIVLLPLPSPKPTLFVYILALPTAVLLCLPYWQAWHLSHSLKDRMKTAFGKTHQSPEAFRLSRVFAGIASSHWPYARLVYDTTHQLTLHFYKTNGSGSRPCVVVIHGGSWSAGNNLQLPELNSELAKAGYHVASINYRLAPANHFPAPIIDVASALKFLRQQATSLAIDSSRFVLLGRSAGAQVSLSAAYLTPDSTVKGVINFYGPADMVWGYQYPTNPLVLNSRLVMQHYLGGTLAEVPRQYQHSSATETVTPGAPPTLSIYGNNDPLVSPLHGHKLSAKLTAANVPHFELYLPWATHGFDYTLNGPGGQVSTWTVKQFLKTVLKE